MIEVEFTGLRSLDQHRARLKKLQQGWKSPHGRTIIDKLVNVLISDNRDARLRGLDKDGKKFIPVKNPNDPRRGGTGEPLDPKGLDSRIVDMMTVTEQISQSQLILTARWTGDIARIIGYHKRGAGFLPIRDPVGLTPAGKSRYRAILKRYAVGMIGKPLD